MTGGPDVFAGEERNGSGAGHTSRRDGFGIFSITLAIVATAFAAAAFWVSSTAQDHAEHASQQADRVAEAATRNEATHGAAGKPASPATSTAVAVGAITLDEQDFTITASSQTVRAGEIAITIHNAGPSSHELLGFRTDLDDATLPLDAGRNVNENSAMMTKVLDTGTDLPPGTQRTMHVNLSPGHYVFACNLPGHFRLGMHLSITVVS